MAGYGAVSCGYHFYFHQSDQFPMSQVVFIFISLGSKNKNKVSNSPMIVLYSIEKLCHVNLLCCSIMLSCESLVLQYNAVNIPAIGSQTALAQCLYFQQLVVANGVLTLNQLTPASISLQPFPLNFQDILPSECRRFLSGT